MTCRHPVYIFYIFIIAQISADVQIQYGIGCYILLCPKFGAAFLRTYSKMTMTAAAITAPDTIQIIIADVIGTISNSDGSNANARNVPAAIVTQINTRSILHGKQLFTTAAIEIKISSRYMTVRHCTAENGANKLVIIIITVTAMPKGAA